MEGGGGGQRRELNVLKILHVSDVLLILLWKYEALAVWTSAEKYEAGPTQTLPWIPSLLHLLISWRSWSTLFGSRSCQQQTLNLPLMVPWLCLLPMCVVQLSVAPSSYKSRYIRRCTRRSFRQSALRWPGHWSVLCFRSAAAAASRRFFPR